MPAEVDEARDELKEDLGDQGLLTVDDASGAVRFLAKLDGFLDSTPSDDPAGATRDYLTDQAEVFGVEAADIGDLRVTGQESSEGIQSLEFTQIVDGVPIVDSSLEAHLDEDGRLLAITGGLVPDPTLDSTEPDVAATRRSTRPPRAWPVRTRPTTASLVAYTSGDELRLAWRVMVNASSTAHYDTLVDAETGEVVRRVEPRQVRRTGLGVRQLSRQRVRGRRHHALDRALPGPEPHAADRAERPRVRGPRRRGAGHGLQRVRAAPGRRDVAQRRHRLPLPLRGVPDGGLRLRRGVPLQLGSEDAVRLDRRRRPGGHPAVLAT